MLLSLEEVSVHFARLDRTNSRPFLGPWFPSTLPTSPKKTRMSDAAVLDRLSLTVAKNDFLAILGPSGSGKTTLLRTVAGLTMPNSGRIKLNGTDISFEPPHKREVSLVFQNGGWYDHLTVEQHFEFDGLSKNDVCRSLRQLDLVDVRSQQPAELSGGQAQRLAIGRALARNRSVLLLDEPFSQLDQSIRESLRQLLRSIHSENRTLVYVTHDQNDAMLLATKIAVLHRGRIQQIGPPKELFDVPNHRCVAEMIGQPQMQFFDVQLSEADRSKLVSSPTSPDSYRSNAFVDTIQYAMTNGALPQDSETLLHVGIRPAAWRVVECETRTETTPEYHHIRFVATFVEERFMGHHRFLQFKVLHSDLPTVLVLDHWTDGPAVLITGTNYKISAAITDLHWFSAKTGNRIATVFSSEFLCR